MIKLCLIFIWTIIQPTLAILGETSEGTSNSMVRLVFRPYTHLRRTICTSETLRTSTRVSPGFVLDRHSSPSFGSYRICSASYLIKVRLGDGDSTLTFQWMSSLSLRVTVLHRFTCIHERLPGPCFKTGGKSPFCHPSWWSQRTTTTSCRMRISHLEFCIIWLDRYKSFRAS